MTPIAPITPTEANRKRKGSIPPYVFDAFNALIVKNLNGGRAVVYQDDVLKELEQRNVTRDEVFQNHWLDVEENFREAGWDVKYERPGYNESGRARAYFTFTGSGEKS